MPKNKKYLLIGLVLMTVIAAGVLFAYDPSESGIFSPCPFHKITGLYCPGCGSLRALHRLFHGDVSEAFALNPLMILVLPFVVYGLAANSLKCFFNKKIPTLFLKSYWIWTLFAVIILYGIARNIPVFPFNYLAP